MIRAIVFDFDGVIANSEPLHFQGFRDVLHELGLALSERDYYQRYLGFDDAGAFAAIASDRRQSWPAERIRELVARKAIRLEELEREISVLFPGARDAIQRLAAACPLAIASGALRAEILRVLEREQLFPFFRTIIGAEDARAGKPAPDPYLRAVEGLSDVVGVSLMPHECVAIEDSRWGLESAAAAGLRTVAVAHTYEADELGQADLVVAHLSQVTWELLTRSLD
jgi:HAD superfamily hydrolase (TIGR01509 family)